MVRRLRAWMMRVAGLLRSGRRDRDLRTEIESHVQLHIRDSILAG